jgi:hypothetical protein
MVIKHHNSILDYKESLGTGNVSINSIPQFYSNSEPAIDSGNRSHGGKNIEKVAKEQPVSRQDLADAKKGQTVAGYRITS